MLKIVLLCHLLLRNGHHDTMVSGLSLRDLVNALLKARGRGKQRIIVKKSRFFTPSVRNLSYFCSKSSPSLVGRPVICVDKSSNFVPPTRARKGKKKKKKAKGKDKKTRLSKETGKQRVSTKKESIARDRSSSKTIRQHKDHRSQIITACGVDRYLR